MWKCPFSNVCLQHSNPLTAKQHWLQQSLTSHYRSLVIKALFDSLIQQISHCNAMLSMPRCCLPGSAYNPVVVERGQTKDMSSHLFFHVFFFFFIATAFSGCQVVFTRWWPGNYKWVTHWLSGRVTLVSYQRRPRRSKVRRRFPCAGVCSFALSAPNCYCALLLSLSSLSPLRNFRNHQPIGEK